MGDEDPETVRVVTEEVRQEAVRWDQVAGTMKEVVPIVNDLYLLPSAFFVGSLAVDAQVEAYRQLHLSLWTAVNGAATEFGEVAQALRRTAQLYDDTDSIASHNIEEVWSLP